MLNSHDVEASQQNHLVMTANVSDWLTQTVTQTPFPSTTTQGFIKPKGRIPLVFVCESWDRLILYDTAIAVICAICGLFGIIYTFFGYRFFKAVMFLTGFIMGSVISYLICSEYSTVLPLAANIGIAIGIGLLCGLVTMLVQYVGLFLTGFIFGAYLAIGVLITMDQFYKPDTKWIAIGIVFGMGLIFAICALKLQKAITILGTSIFGSGLVIACGDYFIELFVLLHYIWDRIRTEPPTEVCWFSWIILGVWPCLFVIGAAIQWRVTGQGVKHNEQQVKVIYKRKKGTANLHHIRTLERRGSANSQYRHLYQVRRQRGDVVSQNFIHSIQHKLTEPTLRSFTPLQSVSSYEGGATNTNSTIMTQVASP